MCHLNKSQAATLMQTLTASLLRRSCSFFRAVSLSFSKGIWVIKACPMADLGSSASSRVSRAIVQMFSVRSASFLTGSRFSSVLHRFSGLKRQRSSGIVAQKAEWILIGFAQYQAFPGDALFSFPSTCFFRAFTRSFSNAALRKCWKASLDDFTEARAIDWLASFAQESAFFRTISYTKIFRNYFRTPKQQRSGSFCLQINAYACPPAARSTARRRNTHDFYLCRM